MYSNYPAFKAAVLSTNPPYDRQGVENMERAWAVYLAAQQPHLKFLVLGRLVGDSTETFPGIDDAMRANLLEMNEHRSGGSIMNSGKWSLLMNDALVLGGIHSYTDFYIASRREKGNVTVPAGERAGGLTVTGRELVGLTMFGYSPRKLPMGEVYVCTDRKAANGASLAGYAREILRYTNDLARRDMLLDVALVRA